MRLDSGPSRAALTASSVSTPDLQTFSLDDMLGDSIGAETLMKSLGSPAQSLRRLVRKALNLSRHHPIWEPLSRLVRVQTPRVGSPFPLSNDSIPPWNDLLSAFAFSITCPVPETRITDRQRRSYLTIDGPRSRGRARTAAMPHRGSGVSRRAFLGSTSFYSWR